MESSETSTRNISDVRQFTCNKKNRLFDPILRLDYKRGYNFSVSVPRWYKYKYLTKSKSIEVHVNVFKEDLCQLVEQMKALVFLDIRGIIHEKKVEPYRSMVQTCFPNSRSNVEIFRFRLWL